MTDEVFCALCDTRFMFDDHTFIYHAVRIPPGGIKNITPLNTYAFCRKCSPRKWRVQNPALTIYYFDDTKISRKNLITRIIETRERGEIWGQEYAKYFNKLMFDD